VPDAAGGGVDSGAVAGGRVSTIEEATERWFERIESPNDVSMKSVAAAIVILLRNVAAPRLPKMVWLDPPNAAPISAPFPAWRRITPIMMKHTNT
jgi:hypothetical protein